jgi:hypothetical protein
MDKIQNLKAGQYESSMRAAFHRALVASSERTKVTGKIFRSLCSKAGIHQGSN